MASAYPYSASDFGPPAQSSGWDQFIPIATGWADRLFDQFVRPPQPPPPAVHPPTGTVTGAFVLTPTTMLLIGGAVLLVLVARK